MRVVIEKEISGALDAPIMLAGWPGYGSVGIRAIQSIREDLGAVRFAQIDLSDELMPDSVVVEDGLVLKTEIPATYAYYVEEPAMILVEGDVQVQGTAALSLMRGVLELAKIYDVREIYTAAALRILMSCQDKVGIQISSNDLVMRDHLVSLGADCYETGQIIGLNGVLLGFTHEYNIPAACVMATMPKYAAPFPNPYSSLCLVEFFSKLLGFYVESKTLKDEADFRQSVMIEIERRIEKVVGLMAPEDYPLPVQDDEAVEKQARKPSLESAMEKIEAMFVELAKNGSKKLASKLKNELDRHDLYEIYEDRFLDLFKEG